MYCTNCFGIRSERQLCEELEFSLVHNWFCRLGLEDQVPNHSTFSVNRHGRFRDGDFFRKVFERIVRQCMDAGLVKGEGFAVDASVIEADASRFQRVEGSEIDWSEEQLGRRAIKEYIEAVEGENSPTNPDRGRGAKGRRCCTCRGSPPSRRWPRRGFA